MINYSKIILHDYGHLIFDKEAKNTHWKNTFSTPGAGQTGWLHVEQLNISVLNHPAQNSTPNGSKTAA